MSRLTKTMFGLMVVNAIISVLILAGIIDTSNIPALDVVFPLAAIFYGMFLICRMLQKDVAEFDAEERKHRELAAHSSHSQSEEDFHGHAHHVPMRA